jgi:hypothetical protein
MGALDTYAATVIAELEEAPRQSAEPRRPAGFSSGQALVRDDGRRNSVSAGRVQLLDCLHDAPISFHQTTREDGSAIAAPMPTGRPIEPK